MEKLITLESVAAPLLEDNIDTDIIFPARFLLSLDRQGLGRHAFKEWRGGEKPFVLDTPPYRGARFLVCGHNFGTGSSREQAVWALADLGIRCIIARSFAEIFRANCLKNGVLTLEPDEVDMRRIEAAAGSAQRMTLDLRSRQLRLAAGEAISFRIADAHREMLMSGQDEIARVLAEDLGAIEAFESRHAGRIPWARIPDERFAALDNETQAHD